MSERCCVGARCFYCDMPLSARHEHDHFPRPARMGGRGTVPVCVNCHDLKDRSTVDAHPAAYLNALADLWARAKPLERIWLAKVYGAIEEVANG